MTLNTYQDGAAFSEDRKYRFALWRVWNRNKPWVMVIGLNPSTANETDQDPTITRIVSIAKHNGYGQLAMLNLFPIVSSDPEILRQTQVLRMVENMEYLNYFNTCADAVVFAWGNFKEARGPVARVIMRQFPHSLCIVQNKNGSPKHPLYCRKDSVFQKFIPTSNQLRF